MEDDAAAAATAAYNCQLMSVITTAVFDSRLPQELLDDAEAPIKRRHVAKNVGYWEETVPTWTDAKFKEHFRVNRQTFNKIISYVATAMTTSDSRFKAALAVDKKVAIALKVSNCGEKCGVNAFADTVFCSRVSSNR